MNISPDEAALSLATIETTQRQSLSRRSYRNAAPFVIGWALVWAVGYTGTATLPIADSNRLWIALILIMTVSTAILIRRRAGRHASWPRILTYTVLPAFAIVLVVNLIAWMFDIHSMIGISALFCLLVAAAYVASGLRFGIRYTGIGLALMALTGAGLALLPPGQKFDIFALDAAILMAAGLWFRRA
jgi:membrane-associated HD superfamily phosphohydrolase